MQTTLNCASCMIYKGEKYRDDTTRQVDPRCVNCRRMDVNSHNKIQIRYIRVGQLYMTDLLNVNITNYKRDSLYIESIDITVEIILYNLNGKIYCLICNLADWNKYKVDLATTAVFFNGKIIKLSYCTMDAFCYCTQYKIYTPEKMYQNVKKKQRDQQKIRMETNKRKLSSIIGQDENEDTLSDTTTSSFDDELEVVSDYSNSADKTNNINHADNANAVSVIDVVASKTVNTKSTDTKFTDAKSTDAKTTDAKSTDAKTTDAKSTDAKTTDAKTMDNTVNKGIKISENSMFVPFSNEHIPYSNMKIRIRPTVAVAVKPVVANTINPVIANTVNPVVAQSLDNKCENRHEEVADENKRGEVMDDTKNNGGTLYIDEEKYMKMLSDNVKNRHIIHMQQNYIDYLQKRYAEVYNENYKYQMQNILNKKQKIIDGRKINKSTTSGDVMKPIDLTLQPETTNNIQNINLSSTSIQSVNIINPTNQNNLFANQNNLFTNQNNSVSSATNMNMNLNSSQVNQNNRQYIPITSYVAMGKEFQSMNDGHMNNTTTSNNRQNHIPHCDNNPNYIPHYVPYMNYTDKSANNCMCGVCVKKNGN